MVTIVWNDGLAADLKSSNFIDYTALIWFVTIHST